MFTRRTAWPTQPNRLTARLNQLRRDGATILDLTESNPTRCGFIYDEEAIRGALAGADTLTYDPRPLGLLSAREAVAAYYEEKSQPVPTDRIFLTTGSSEAYTWCFRLLCEPGDEVLAPAPSYPLFDFLADLNDVRLKTYPLRYGEGWYLDYDALRAAITDRTRAILLVSPNNPTGSFLTPNDRDKLIRIALRHNLSLIVDEVFLDYPWDAETQIETFNPKGMCPTFIISGLSKISALPQMKLGWIAARGPSEALADASARLEIIADTYLSVATPTQLAAPVLLEQRKLLQPQLLDRIAANRSFLDSRLGTSPISRMHGEAGWYAVLRVPTALTDEEWAVFLLETTGVHLHPGHFFGFDRDGYLVVSLIPPAELFQEGMSRLIEAIK